MKLNVEKGESIGFVRTIYNDFYTVAKQKNITMSFTPWTSNHEILFDQEKVETIVYNLLSNAVKYTPDRGIISVRLYLENDIVFFSVEDNGPGIKPEREADLFKPFMHGYASKGGMGIGLYTAHKMAKSTRVRSPISVPGISEAAASALPCQTMPASISRRISSRRRRWTTTASTRTR